MFQRLSRLHVTGNLPIRPDPGLQVQQMRQLDELGRGGRDAGGNRQGARVPAKERRGRLPGFREEVSFEASRKSFLHGRRENPAGSNDRPAGQWVDRPRDRACQ